VNAAVTGAQLLPPNRLQVHVAQVSVNIRGHYHIQVGTSWLHVSKDGEITASTTGATASSIVSITSRAGHPWIAPAECSANLGNFDITFHGGIIDDIINLFKGLIEDYLKGKIDRMLCQELESVESQEANAMLAQIPIEIELPGAGHGFHIDYGLTSDPIATNRYIAIPIQGKFWYTAHENDPQIPAPDGIITPLNSNEMVCFEFDADEVFGSAIYALETSPLSHFTIDANILNHFPPQLQSFFQCSCADNLCIGALIPQIQQHCPPGGVIEIEAAADTFAHITFNSSGAFIGLSGLGGYRARLPNGDITHLFDVHAALGVQLMSNLRIDGWTIKGATQLYEATFTGSSLIGPIDMDAFQSIWSYALHTVTDQILNQVLENGIPLPAIPYVIPINPRFIFTAHELTFCSDLQAHTA